ncbi:MAG: PEP/pyruvate-binding domain-containing protein [Desulfobacterales bacterium]|jgi:pyruvate,water dikinase
MLLKNLFKHWTYQVFAPGTALRGKYEAFKSLLSHDKRAHELMAELEDIYHGSIKVDFNVIAAKYGEFSNCIFNIVEDLTKISPYRYANLREYFKKFDAYIQFMLVPPKSDCSAPYAVSFGDISSDHPSQVGGKALNLAIINKDLDLPTPDGFVITTNAFYFFIEFNRFQKLIDEKLSQLDITSSASLDTISNELRQAIIDAPIPADLEESIFHQFEALQRTNRKHVRLAMRSSAVGEDTQFSFAGQYTTVLNVGEDDILDAYKTVIASKYSAEAIYYRINYGLSDFETPMAVLALEMINAKTSGIIYTEDIEDPTSDHLKIHSTWGLGEVLVNGEVSPDIITVSKDDRPQIVDKQIGLKRKQMVYKSDHITETIAIDDSKKNRPSLDDEMMFHLAKWGLKIASHFQEPQDIEWCADQDANLFLLQARPLRMGEAHATAVLECNFEEIENTLLISGGECASSGIGAGKVFKIEQESDLENLEDGAVLVARNAAPHYVKVMNKLSAVVTDTGSAAGHFASVAREFGVPTLVNTAVATAKLAAGSEITVYPDDKVVYEGIVHTMLESTCARRDLMVDSPFMRKLKYIMSFISPLKLFDPQADSFTPEGVRSMHDIMRFCHEKAVQEMFQISKRRIRKIGSAKKLHSEIPMLLQVLDVGGGLKKDLADEKTVTFDDILSVPMKAVIDGLSHPGIRWGHFTHFDWAEHDKIVMSGGIISPEATMFASHAVISEDYLNLNLKFGYHFVIVDAICTHQSEDNYILFRFSGGGADLHKRSLRADFLSQVLMRLGFEVSRKSDLVDAQLKAADKKTIERRLDRVGRLLGATRLMDMYLKDESMVEGFVEDFMNGRYHFATIDDAKVQPPRREGTKNENDI